MTTWHVILAASILVAGLKVLGHVVPAGPLEGPRPRRILELVTVSLLSALVAVQTLADGTALVVDARVPAVVLAVVLYRLRVPFLVVVIGAAAVAAVLRRFAGWA
ncbi:AzlD domain-containing protein [Agrococcus jejuensis]|uniref:Branched-chain amino acid transport protein (AzlD) n=1 Tax=Agrococcus jejuensis TaxID=399736 RepID=A0A1G8AEI8_9MICO|nr:AzlD domain-containing protein [Agrococcus jejuensis]SDH18740.1 Branched-chain amino acid transport protein (AzlD) [Agrococcus jejuensis]